MKTILVLTGGGDTDAVAFNTAFTAAKALGAHLEFLHVCLSAADAAQFTMHVDFTTGAALSSALDLMSGEQTARSANALRHFREFCAREAITISDAPLPGGGVSASWREEHEAPLERMMQRARHNDLIVVARPEDADGLPADLIERLLVGCGRPLLIAPHRMRTSLTGTVLVFWNETGTAARALGASLPILANAKRVVIVTVDGPDTNSQATTSELAQQLAWHGIDAEISTIRAGSGSATEHLEAAAKRFDADLLVMGGYSHSRVREAIFGGCTRHFLEAGEHPLLMMH